CPCRSSQGLPVWAGSRGDVSRAFLGLDLLGAQSAPSDRSRSTPSVLACPVPLARKPYGSSRPAKALPRRSSRQFGDRASGSCPRIVAWVATIPPGATVVENGDL